MDPAQGFTTGSNTGGYANVKLRIAVRSATKKAELERVLHGGETLRFACTNAHAGGWE